MTQDLQSFLKDFDPIESLGILHNYGTIGLSKKRISNQNGQIEIQKFLIKPDIQYQESLLEPKMLFLINRFIIEVIKYGQINYLVLGKKSLKDIHNVNKLYDLLMKIDTQTTKQNTQNNLFHKEFNRTMYEQIYYETFDLISYCSKFYSIYQNSNIQKVFLEKTGVCLHDYIGTGLSMFAIGYLKDKNKFADFHQSIVQHILKELSISLTDSRKQMVESEQINGNFFYSSHKVLYDKPIIAIENGLYTMPFPLHFLKQLFEGIYYRCCKNKQGKIDTAFTQLYADGFANQYMKKVLFDHESLIIKVIDGHIEASGGSIKTPGSTDWIIYDDDYALFIECKAKTLTYKSWIDIYDTTSLANDITVITNALNQNYEAIQTAISKKYPQFIHNNQKFINIVITPTDWMLDLQLDIEGNTINIKGQRNIPYFITDTGSFEKMIHNIYDIGIAKFFEHLKEDNIQTFSLRSYLNTYYTHKSYSYFAFQNEFFAVREESLSS